MAYPAGYPSIDWDTAVQALLPDIAANGDGLAFAKILVDPLRRLDDQAARLYAGILEIEDADEDILDLLGDMVGERRVGGMSSTLYRRLIAGRRVARAGGVTRARLYAGWRALTGSDAATMDEPGSGTVRLVAAVDYTPTDLWLTRAGSIVRDLVGAGYEASAMVVTPTSARFASPTSPWGVGRWAYQLRVNGAP